MALLSNMALLSGTLIGYSFPSDEFKLPQAEPWTRISYSIEKLISQSSSNSSTIARCLCDMGSIFVSFTAPNVAIGCNLKAV